MEQRRNEWVPTSQAEMDAENESYISEGGIKEDINECERSSGMTLDEFKKGVSDGGIQNYSIVQLKMWEQMERLLEKRNKMTFGLDRIIFHGTPDEYAKHIRQVLLRYGSHFEETWKALGRMKLRRISKGT